MTSTGPTPFERAIEEEELIRSAAFLGLTERLRFDGPPSQTVEVLPMTIRHLLELTIAQSPFLLDGLIKDGPPDLFIEAGLVAPEHVVSLLWCVSLDRGLAARSRWKLRGRWIKDRFIKCLARLPFLPAVETVRAYCRDAFMDWPHSGNSNRTPHFSGHAILVHLLASSYGWSLSEIERLPLKAVWQLLNQQNRERDPKYSLSNPRSDKARWQWINANRDRLCKRSNSQPPATN